MKKKLEINASVKGEMGGVVVRSSEEGSSFLENSKISIFIDGSGYESSVTTYIRQSGEWCECSSDPIYLNDEYAKVYGEYPSEEKDSTGTKKVVVPSVARKVMPVIISNPQKFDAANQSDYMYALASVRNRVPYALSEVNNDNNTASLVFMHGMSELTFTIKTEGTFSGPVYVTRIRLSKSGNDFRWGKGYMSLEASPSSRFDSLKTGSELVFAGVREITSSAIQISGLVVPSTSENISIEMSIVINGKTSDIHGVLPAGEGNSKFEEWESGKNYEYSIIVKNGELTIDSVEIMQWETIQGGEVEVE
jgi:hypothetical protein